MTTRTTDNTLALAAATLRAVAAANAAVFLFVGDPIPAGQSRLIQLAFADDLPDADFESEGEQARVQVNAVAPKLADAVRLGRAVRLGMEAAGFTRRGGRSLPKAAGETLNGVAADYVR